MVSALSHPWTSPFVTRRSPSPAHRWTSRTWRSLPLPRLRGFGVVCESCGGCEFLAWLGLVSRQNSTTTKKQRRIIEAQKSIFATAADRPRQRKPAMYNFSKRRKIALSCSKYHRRMIAMQSHDDRRKTPRVHIGNLVASVDLLDGDDPKTVCVWDISLGGACLMVAPEVALSERFDLVINGESHPVKKVWRREFHVGVQLCLAPHPRQLAL
jgi:hypothetical protein